MTTLFLQTQHLDFGRTGPRLVEVTLRVFKGAIAVEDYATGDILGTLDNPSALQYLRVRDDGRTIIHSLILLPSGEVRVAYRRLRQPLSKPRHFGQPNRCWPMALPMEVGVLVLVGLVALAYLLTLARFA